MPFVKAVTLPELPPGTAKEIRVGGRTLALFNVEGKVYALDSQCTHRNAPLAEGECEGSELICPWHGARFDLNTGAALCPPAKQGVAVYKVQVVGEEIQVDL
jgi:3-phenylpropionate/trans-cinnamate dioxygenase ferredoxin subunit